MRKIVTTVTGPILLPNTPDCDYNNGEELLSTEKIRALKNSYDKYGIVDYNHKFTDSKHLYYMKNVGTPKKLFITEKSVTYTDIHNQTITTPPGTLWATVEVNDTFLEQAIADGSLGAYSVTVAEKTDADLVLNEYKTRLSKKNDEPVDLSNLYEKIAEKRVLISDIKEPRLLTISLTSMPCVYKAKFCKNVIHESDEEYELNTKSRGETMGDEPNKDNSINETTFMDRLKSNLTALKNYNATETKKDGKSTMDKKETEKLISDNLNAFKNEMADTVSEQLNDVLKQYSEKNNEQISKIKEEMDSIHAEYKKSFKHEEENDKDADTEGEEGSEEMSNKNGVKNKKTYTESDQIPHHHDGIGSGKSTPRAQMTEREVLMRMIKGTNVSSKSFEDVDILYDDLKIIPQALKSSPEWLNIHPALKDEFAASFTEANTEKLILPTNQYALYMRELLSVDPLMQDANFRIDYEVSEEERYMYTLRLDADVTQDGIMEEHYYFDNPNIKDANIEVSRDKLNPMPVRTRLHISDRQIKLNVFGENLLTNALALVKANYDEGISRINYFGDTELDDSVDIKFRRRDGLFKQAGSKLVSDDVGTGANVFNLDDGIDQVFKQMFRKLPFEAQKAQFYNLYVPPYVYEAYREYYLNNDKINFIGNITDEIPLKYKRITIKEAPILADNKGIELNGGNVSMLLTAPQNTHFLASRALRLEPQRIPDTSSTKYWYTGDFDMRFAMPEYAVSATISKEEYQAL